MFYKAHSIISVARFTCNAAVDSSLGNESIRTSMSLAVRAMRAANSWAYSVESDEENNNTF